MRTKKIVYRTTAEGRNLLAAAEHFVGYDVSEVYKQCSSAKITAFEDLYDEYCRDLMSYDFHITSANSFQFSVSWKSYQGCTPYTRYITAKYDYWIF